MKPTTKSAIVLYHANCTDGYASAWAFHKLMEPVYPSTTYIPVEYSSQGYLDTIVPFNDSAENIDLYILDFSFYASELLEARRYFHTITLLDHHKSAQENLSEITEEAGNLKVVFDMGKSGAGLSWEYFSSGEWISERYVSVFSQNFQTRPAFINYVEDRDLWKFSLPFSKEISTYLNSLPHNFEVYEEIAQALKDDLYGIKSKGEAQMVYQDRLIESIKKNAVLKKIAGHMVPVCNCPGALASELGNILSERESFSLTWYLDHLGTVRCSLRSRKAYGKDVSVIAKKLGDGGGHENASGFSLPLYEFLNLLDAAV